MIKIIEVQTACELEQAKELFREYFQFLVKADELAYSYQGAEEELASLPGKFAPPDGKLIIAIMSEQPIGCVALRRIASQVCELKRMFVLPQFRRQGVAKALVSKLIEYGRTIGYERMRLDTGEDWIAAIGLYESLGFERIEPDSDVPEDFRQISVFMELRLS